MAESSQAAGVLLKLYELRTEPTLGGASGAEPGKSHWGEPVGPSQGKASGAGPSTFVFNRAVPQLVAPSSIPRSSEAGFLYPARIPR